MKATPANPLYASQIKRVFDVLSAVALLAPALPLTLLAAAALWADLGESPWYTQLRPGRYGRPFRLYKLKTMRTAYSENGELMPDSQRITRFSRWLRTSSIDELPQLINVLQGHMSIVGPRPLLMEYLPLYTQRQQLRHQVPPGITGLSQVMVRNDAPWAEKLELDARYAEQCSLRTDAMIVLRTFKVVASGQGAYPEGTAEVPRLDDFLKAQQAN